MSKVIHQAVTPPLKDMPAQERLWLRDGVYYFRMRIPRPLKAAGASFIVNGKLVTSEIRFSLQTSNYKQAAKAAALQTAIWSEQFNCKEKELLDYQRLEEAKQIATSCKLEFSNQRLLSDERIREIIVRDFIQTQKDSTKFITSGLTLNAQDRNDALWELGRELETYKGVRDDLPPSGIETSLEKLLSDNGLQELPKDGIDYQSILRGYRAALIEDARRTIHEFDKGFSTEFDSQFKGIHADSPLPDSKSGKTIAETIESFHKDQLAAKVSSSTHKTNIPVFRALKEFFGAHLTVSKITQEQMVSFFDFMDTLPTNVSQRYKDKTLREAIALEAKKPTQSLLSEKTREKYHGRVVTIFNHAKEMGFLTANHASMRLITRRYQCEKKSTRPTFTPEELNLLFRAPLFTGCEGDLLGWQRKGDTVQKRGRYWVPLLALLQGLRCNEACQLEIGDIGIHKSVQSINITDEAEEDEDGKKSKAQKGLKTKASKVRLPLHPLLIRLGFLDFVESRTNAGDGKALFPELPVDSEGRYSKLFSQWFGRFINKTLTEKGFKTKARFHSFRHNFRDETRRAKLHGEMAFVLGRWALHESAANHYGDGYDLSALAEQQALMTFESVDLSHLMAYTKSGVRIRLRPNPVI